MRYVPLAVIAIALLLFGCSSDSNGVAPTESQINPKSEGSVLSWKYYGPLHGGKFSPAGYSAPGLSAPGSHYQDGSTGDVHVMCYPNNTTCFSVSTDGSSTGVNNGGGGSTGVSYVITEGP